MKHLTCAYTAGRSTPINDEARRTGHSAGLRDNVNQQRNFSVNPLAPQDQRAKLRLLDRIGIWVKAPWIFLGHLLRLKNVGLALWVTDYDLSPDATGGAQ